MIRGNQILNNSGLSFLIHIDNSGLLKNAKIGIKEVRIFIRWVINN